MEVQFRFVGFSAKIAKWHEAGAGNLPERKHLTRFYRERAKTLLSSHINKNINTFLGNKEKFLRDYGNVFISEYKAWMLAGNAKPDLKEKTIESKRRMGSSTAEIPLVNSGAMIDSLVFDIIK